MFDRFVRGWELTKQSFRVLRTDKQLILFPLLSSLSLLLVIISFVLPVALAVDWEAIAKTEGNNTQFRMPIWGYGVLFLFYFTQYTVIAFFNSALIACAINRFNGEDSHFSAGLAAATRRLPQILAWSLLNSTVGVVLQMISEKAGIIGKIVISLIGVVWSIATFFVVPVLVIEGVGPFTAVKRSTKVLSKVWGESIVANVSVSGIMSLIGLVVVGGLMFAGIALGIAFESVVLGIVLVALGLLAGVILALISSTLKMIVIAACYRYATTGLIAEHFEGDTLRAMFRKK